jgi:hypothetical protein
MSLFAAFCGGSHTERSRAIDAERTVNLYRSTVESAAAAKQAYLLGTPGRRRLGTVDDTGCRGIWTQDGRTVSVVGTTLVDVTLDPYTATVRGAIADDGSPVSMSSNGAGGQQLAIVGGGELKILDLVTNGLSAAIALPMSGTPVMVGYLDGYFLLSEATSPIVWFSTLEDGTTWDALDFFTRSTASDFVVALVCANNRVWIFGSETSEAYEDVGDADNPFQPIHGSLFQLGCAAPWSVNADSNTLRWVGRSSRGGAAVYRLSGYSGTRISTHAEEAILGAATTLTDAEALTYEQDGHLFYALTCPSSGVAGVTLVLDETESSWHERAGWDASHGRETAWPVRGHAYVGQTHLVGSRDNGALCALDLATYADDGAVLRAVRRAPYLGAENAYAFLDRIELGIESGVGLTSGQGSDPQVELRISKDSATTWFSAGTAALGAIGDHGAAAIWTRLGACRIDRLVLEVVITDPVKRVLGPGCWITATPGRASQAAA